MPRPKCCRHVCGVPDKNYFKPRGIPASDLEEAAAKMNISRQTFGRIVEAAHKKIADVLMNGKALKIEGGEVAFDETKPCGHGKGHRVGRNNQSRV